MFRLASVDLHIHEGVFARNGCESRPGHCAGKASSSQLQKAPEIQVIAGVDWEQHPQKGRLSSVQDTNY